MIITLNQDNKLELTDKAFIIRAFRELYRYYAEKLNSEDRAMAAFSIMYYMHFFDSRFLLEHPKDLKVRLAEVKAFVYMGDKVNTETKLFKAAEELYKTLMDEEQSSIYLVMKNNVKKMKDYAEAMVLVKENSAEATEEEIATDSLPLTTTNKIKVTFKEFREVNASLPEQEEILRKFKDKLLQHFKGNIDIYGGGDIGAYEKSRVNRN